MPRVIGIDPGSGSYDLCGLNDGRVYIEESIPTDEVAEDPQRLLDVVDSAGRLDAAVVPSGYGLPLKHLRDLRQHDLFYLSLIKPNDKVTVPELKVSYEKILNSILGMGIDAYILPGVIHLDTVAAHKKANRIDMGTPDKLCSATVGIHDQSSRLHLDYAETSFILLELGYAYTAALAVEGGKIVDGIGGTSGPPGFLAMGAMDGELAYLLGDFSKDLLFEGGAESIADRRNITPQQLLSESARSGRPRLALETYLEGLQKSVLALHASVEKPREILLSGRLSHIRPLARVVAGKLGSIGKVRIVNGISRRCKESAQGAAMLADGIAGGSFSRLLQVMRIQHASGTVLDHVYLPSVHSLRPLRSGSRSRSQASSQPLIHQPKGHA